MAIVPQRRCRAARGDRFRRRGGRHRARHLPCPRRPARAVHLSPCRRRPFPATRPSAHRAARSRATTTIVGTTGTAAEADAEDASRSFRESTAFPRRGARARGAPPPQLSVVGPPARLIQETMRTAPHLYPVDYDGAVWDRRLKGGFRAVLDAFNAYVNAGNPRSERLVERRTVVALAQIAALASIAAKRWDLRDEQEWRQVIYPASDATVEWKTNEGGRRYLAVPARAEGKLLLLDRVIVRSADPDAAVEKVIDSLRAAGYPSADVPMPEIVVSTYPLNAKAACRSSGA